MDRSSSLSDTRCPESFISTESNELKINGKFNSLPPSSLTNHFLKTSARVQNQFWTDKHSTKGKLSPWEVLSLTSPFSDGCCGGLPEQRFLLVETAWIVLTSLEKKSQLFTDLLVPQLTNISISQSMSNQSRLSLAGCASKSRCSESAQWSNWFREDVCGDYDVRHPQDWLHFPKSAALTTAIRNKNHHVVVVCWVMTLSLIAVKARITSRRWSEIHRGRQRLISLFARTWEFHWIPCWIQGW